MTDERLAVLIELSKGKMLAPALDECVTEIRRLRRFVAVVDIAFAANKNFMWGDGKFSVLSRIRAARAALEDEGEEDATDR